MHPSSGWPGANFIFKCVRQHYRRWRIMSQTRKIMRPVSSMMRVAFFFFFPFSRKQLLPCGLGLLGFWSSFVCLGGVGTTVSTVLSRLMPPAVLWGQAGKPKTAPKAAGPGGGMLCRGSLMSTASRSALVHAGVSTQGINSCVKGKGTRIRRIKIQYSLRALSSLQEACWTTVYLTHVCQRALKGSPSQCSKKIHPDYLLRCFLWYRGGEKRSLSLKLLLGPRPLIGFVLVRLFPLGVWYFLLK